MWLVAPYVWSFLVAGRSSGGRSSRYVRFVVPWLLHAVADLVVVADGVLLSLCIGCRGFSFIVKPR
jgi:hypothetical protein